MTCVASVEQEGIVQQKGTMSTYILIARPEGEARSERLLSPGVKRSVIHLATLTPGRPANPIFLLTSDDGVGLEVRAESSVERYYCAGITGGRGGLQRRQGIVRGCS